jgi:hypothetical protein
MENTEEAERRSEMAEEYRAMCVSRSIHAGEIDNGESSSSHSMYCLACLEKCSDPFLDLPCEAFVIPSLI